MKILLSDGSDEWISLLDDIIQIKCHVMSCPGLLVFTLKTCKMGISSSMTTMRAFLIVSVKSKKQNGKAVLLEESIIDVKAMCKVRGHAHST